MSLELSDSRVYRRNSIYCLSGSFRIPPAPIVCEKQMIKIAILPIVKTLREQNLSLLQYYAYCCISNVKNIAWHSQRSIILTE